MGKETELWDDSALINAFENAMSKYKVMHSTTYQGNHPEDSTTNQGNHPEEEVVNGINENRPAIIFETKTQLEADDISHNVLNSATETSIPCYEIGAANELSPIQESNPNAESCTLEPSMHSSSGPPIKETFERNSDLQGFQYNHLLGQYYELEEQRQKVLQQLYQASYWNYQSSGEGSGSSEPWNACCSQAHNASHPGLLSSCCPYSCHCLAAPCPSIPVCCFGAQCPAKNGTNVTATDCSVEPVMLSTLADDSVVKTAMGAAERALYSMRMKVSEISKSCEEKEKGITESTVSQNVNSETDLTEVLSAWYSAGFYTGKYLSEQLIRKGQP